jgi:hypothetical protein
MIFTVVLALKNVGPIVDNEFILPVGGLLHGKAYQEQLALQIR